MFLMGHREAHGPTPLFESPRRFGRVIRGEGPRPVSAFGNMLLHPASGPNAKRIFDLGQTLESKTPC